MRYNRLVPWWDNWCNCEDVDFSVLLGKTLTAIEVDRDLVSNDDSIRFGTSDGDVYCMFHRQACCENVSIKDIVGGVEDLIGTPILMAEVTSNDGEEDYGTSTWTFYKLRTIKGSVDISWYGSSNGYYSEGVDFVKRKVPA